MGDANSKNSKNAIVGIREWTRLRNAGKSRFGTDVDMTDATDDVTKRKAYDGDLGGQPRKVPRTPRTGSYTPTSAAVADVWRQQLAGLQDKYVNRLAPHPVLPPHSPAVHALPPNQDTAVVPISIKPEAPRYTSRDQHSHSGASGESGIHRRSTTVSTNAAVSHYTERPRPDTGRPTTERPATVSHYISGSSGPGTVSSHRGRSGGMIQKETQPTGSRGRDVSPSRNRSSLDLTTSSGFHGSVVEYMGKISGIVCAPIGLIIASVFSAFSASVAHGAAQSNDEDGDDESDNEDYETEGTSLVVLIMQLAAVFASIVVLFYIARAVSHLLLMMPEDEYGVIEYAPGQMQIGAGRPSVNQGFGKDATTTTGESARRSIDEMRAYLAQMLTGFLKFNDESGSRFKFRRVCTEVMCRLLEVKVHTANGIAGAMREWPCVSALAVAALTDTYQSVGSLLVTFHKNGEHEVPSAKGSKPMQKRYFLLETTISKMKVPVSVEVPLRESKVLQLIYLLDSYGAVFAGDKATIEAFNKGLSRALQQPNHADGAADPVLVIQKILGWLGVTADAHDVRLASNGAYKTKANKETKEAKEAKEIILSAVSLYFRGIRKGPEHGPPALLLLLKQGA